MPTRVAVTGGTRRAESLENFVDVTALTLYIDMRARERKLRFVVIEGGIFPA